MHIQQEGNVQLCYFWSPKFEKFLIALVWNICLLTYWIANLSLKENFIRLPIEIYLSGHFQQGQTSWSKCRESFFSINCEEQRSPMKSTEISFKSLKWRKCILPWLFLWIKGDLIDVFCLLMCLSSAEESCFSSQYATHSSRV